MFYNEGRAVPFLGSSMIDSIMGLISIIVFSMGYMKIKTDDDEKEN